MNSSTTPQTAASPSAPKVTQIQTEASSEPSTRSSSPFQGLNVTSRTSQRDRANTVRAEPLFTEYSPSVTPISSPPYTRQGSLVDLEDLKKDPYITVNAKTGDNRKEPYHVFSHGKKWSIVILIGVAGLFSGLSSNIYFPALDAIAKVSLGDSNPIITELVLFY